MLIRLLKESGVLAILAVVLALVLPFVARRPSAFAGVLAVAVLAPALHSRVLTWDVLRSVATLPADRRAQVVADTIDAALAGPVVIALALVPVLLALLLAWAWRGHWGSWVDAAIVVLVPALRLGWAVQRNASEEQDVFWPAVMVATGLLMLRARPDRRAVAALAWAGLCGLALHFAYTASQFMPFIDYAGLPPPRPTFEAILADDTRNLALLTTASILATVPAVRHAGRPAIILAAAIGLAAALGAHVWMLKAEAAMM